MANVLRFNQFSYSTAVPYHLYASVSIGASGAPTIVSGTGRGINSIVRNSAGKYTITLGKQYAGLITAQIQVIGASGAAPAAPISYVFSESVSSAGTLILQFLAIDGSTATDPASGERLMLDIVVQNSSLSY